jgi:hypothetical protein
MVCFLGAALSSEAVYLDSIRCRLSPGRYKGCLRESDLSLSAVQSEEAPGVSATVWRSLGRRDPLGLKLALRDGRGCSAMLTIRQSCCTI